MVPLGGSAEGSGAGGEDNEEDTDETSKMLPQAAALTGGLLGRRTPASPSSATVDSAPLPTASSHSA